MEVVEMKPLSEVRYTPPSGAENGDTPVKITLTLPKRDVEKLYAWMDSDDFEKARAIREADFEQGAESVAALLRLTREHLGTSGGRVAATLLGSLYNGGRVKLDVSDLKLLDQPYFEHAMRAIRVCCECHLEPHQFFRNGGELFEHMIKTWGLEKRRRASR